MLFCGFKDSIEPAYYGHGQDDSAVFANVIMIDEAVISDSEYQ